MKVISLGGSLIVPNKIDINFLNKFKKLIVKLSKNEKVIVVCGGGKTCRNYNTAAKHLTKPSNLDLDYMGIQATRLNAELVRIMLGKLAYKKIIYNPNEKVKFKKVLVAAGWEPGCSSDYDAVLLAKTHKFTEVINLTNIDYVYDKDPKKYKNAKPIKNISWNNFLKIIGTKWIPGKNFPFDPIASKLAKKLNLKVKILNGNNLKNIGNCLTDKEFKGTIIG